MRPVIWKNKSKSNLYVCYSHLLNKAYWSEVIQLSEYMSLNRQCNKGSFQNKRKRGTISSNVERLENHFKVENSYFANSLIHWWVIFPNFKLSILCFDTDFNTWCTHMHSMTKHICTFSCFMRRNESRWQFIQVWRVMADQRETLNCRVNLIPWFPHGLENL